MKNNKGFANMVLIGVVIVLIAIGGYFVLKSKQQPVVQPATSTGETVNLKTYTNDKYSFELKYPNGYLLTESNSGILIESSKSCANRDNPPKDCFGYSLLIQKNKITGGDGDHVPSVQVAGYSSERFEIKYGMYDNESQIYIQFIKDGTWYISYITYNSENKTVAENLLNQILSTFKFTGQTTQTNTSFKTGSISSAYVYGPELNKVKVFLYASDENKTITAPTDISCANPSGSEISRGNYKLIVDSTTATSDNPGGNSDLTWKDSTLDVGSMEFVKGTLWDGKITADIFDPIGYKNFIVFQKYGSCNGTFMQIYRYDLFQGKLVQYKFVKKDNSSSNDIFVTNYKKSSSGNLVTSAYDNTVGKTIDTE